jgi:hypothetical protein
MAEATENKRRHPVLIATKMRGRGFRRTVIQPLKKGSKAKQAENLIQEATPKGTEGQQYFGWKAEEILN